VASSVFKADGARRKGVDPFILNSVLKGNLLSPLELPGGGEPLLPPAGERKKKLSSRKKKNFRRRKRENLFFSGGGGVGLRA